MLHWAGGAGGKGALLSGDVIQVGQDRKSAELHAQLSQLHPRQRPRGSASCRVEPRVRASTGWRPIFARGWLLAATERYMRDAKQAFQFSAGAVSGRDQ